MNREARYGLPLFAISNGCYKSDLQSLSLCKALLVLFRNYCMQKSRIDTMKLITLLSLLVKASIVSAQSLLNATANYTQLSDFRLLLMTNANAATRLLTNVTLSAGQKITVLIPSNDAFAQFQQNNSMPVSALASSDLANILDYHTLQGSLSSSDLQQPMGLTAPTALTNQTYDNRGLASNGAKIPQVVYISSVNTANGTVTTVKRQITSAGANFDIRSGKGLQTTLEPVNGVWSGGMFQIVNSSVTAPCPIPFPLSHHTQSSTPAHLLTLLVPQIPHPPRQPNQHHGVPRSQLIRLRPCPNKRNGRNKRRPGSHLRLPRRPSLGRHPGPLHAQSD